MPTTTEILIAVGVGYIAYRIVTAKDSAAIKTVVKPEDYFVTDPTAAKAQTDTTYRQQLISGKLMGADGRIAGAQYY